MFQAVRIACLYDFEAILLVVDKDCAFVDQAMSAKNAVGYGEVSQWIVPHNSAILSILMRGRMSADDIIVTESCLVAFEALCSGAGAICFFGNKYDFENIFDSMDYYWQQREQRDRVKRKHWAKKYSYETRRRFKEQLFALVQEKCGYVTAETLPLRQFANNPSATPIVYVDADSCFVVPEIVNLCSEANRISVFVSNVATQPTVTKTLSKAIKENNASLVAVKKVPKGKNSADQFIINHVHAEDIVICDDLPLTRTCMNKGAIVIDSYGRIYKREVESETITLAKVKAERELHKPKKKKSKHRRKELFYDSMSLLLNAS